VAVAARAGPEVSIELVDAAFDPLAAPEAGLVAEGVGEGLDPVRVGNRVAMGVDERMQVGEGQGAVAGEEREAHPAQFAAVEGDGVGLGRRDGRLVVVGGPGGMDAAHTGPELLAQVVEFIDHPAAPPGEVFKGAVALGQIDEQVAALGLELEPGAGMQLRVEPKEGLPLTAQRWAPDLDRCDFVGREHHGIGLSGNNAGRELHLRGGSDR
jgi:hypothetical protein